MQLSDQFYAHITSLDTQIREQNRNMLATLGAVIGSSIENDGVLDNRGASGDAAIAVTDLSVLHFPNLKSTRTFILHLTKMYNKNGSQLESRGIKYQPLPSPHPLLWLTPPERHRANQSP